MLRVVSLKPMPLETATRSATCKQTSADAGAAYAAIASFRPDIVVHAAAIPDMTHNTGHDVLKANTMSTYNIIEACLSLGVRKMVNISSLQILGIVKSDHDIFACRASRMYSNT